MDKENSQRLFEKHNPASAIVRCPKGRSKVRDLLDLYARAAVNLYGIILIDELVEIFNSQNTEQTSSEEIRSLLLPLIIKKQWYCFCNDYIVHYVAIWDFDYVDYMVHQHGNKPRYSPDKEEFLKHVDEWYEDKKQKEYWWDFRQCINKIWPDLDCPWLLCDEIKETMSNKPDINKVFEALARHNAEFSSEKEINKFLEKLNVAHNNSRTRENKGYSPLELTEVMKENGGDSVELRRVEGKRKKINASALCPCGSGKKYKNCCGIIEREGKAKLSKNDSRLFYTIWYGLLGFVNRRFRIIEEEILPVLPNPVLDSELVKVRNTLWENPSVILDFILESDFNQETIDILMGWYEHHLKNYFIAVDYKTEYTVLLSNNKDEKDTAFGVKGISNTISSILQSELPVTFSTVLLPFRDVIVYDTYLERLAISFTDNSKELFKELYQVQKEKGIITSWAKQEDPDEKSWS